MTASDEHERKEQQARSASWYAILGLGALVAAAFFILRWIPDNPFHTPSEVPITSRFNSEQLTGSGAPLVAAPPSTESSIGPGCRVGDVALVQEWRGALRQTTVDSLLGYQERARGRGLAFRSQGWSARAVDAGAGCRVVYTWLEGRAERQAVWDVSPDRRTVSPVNDLARGIGTLLPRPRRR